MTSCGAAVTRRLCIIFRMVPQAGLVTSRCLPNLPGGPLLSSVVPALARQALVRQLFVLGFGRRLAQLLVSCGGGLPRWPLRDSSPRVVCMSSYSCLIQWRAVSLPNALVNTKHHTHIGGV